MLAKVMTWPQLTQPMLKLFGLVKLPPQNKLTPPLMPRAPRSLIGLC